MNTTYSNHTPITYQWEPGPDQQIGHLTFKARAFHNLFGACNISVRGTWLDDTGEPVFMTYRDCPVVNIGRKYLEVDLGHEGRVKLVMTGGEHQRVIFTNRSV